MTTQDFLNFLEAQRDRWCPPLTDVDEECSREVLTFHMGQSDLRYQAVIDQAWDMLQQVATAEGWSDTPPRPKPDGYVHHLSPSVDQPAFTRRALCDRLFELQRYCNRKLTQPPAKLPKPTIRLNQQMRNIIKALLKAEDTLTADQLAIEAGYDNHSGFRTTLGFLSSCGLIENDRPGYRLTPAGRTVLDDA